jgi:transcriptional regulator with XRE-family HTH domain
MSSVYERQFYINFKREYMPFSESLQSSMNKAGITAYGLSKITGVSSDAIGKWLKGTQPTLDKLIPIADYLEVTLDELAGRTTPELTKREIELLRLYNGLSDEDKDTVDGLALFLFSKR